MTIQRNSVGVGLVVDVKNTVVDLAVGSAAAEHGGIFIGDTVVAVNREQIPAGSKLAPFIPKGSAPFTLTLERRTDAAGAAASKWSAPRRTSSAKFTEGGDRASPPTKRPAESGGAKMGRSLTQAQVDELRDAFHALGGSSTKPISADQALAALIHFEPDISPSACDERVHAISDRSDGLLTFKAFCALLLYTAEKMDDAHSLFNLVDENGRGAVTLSDAFDALSSLSPDMTPLASGAASTLKLQPADDVAALVDSLREGDERFITREDFEKKVRGHLIQF